MKKGWVRAMIFAYTHPGRDRWSWSAGFAPVSVGARDVDIALVRRHPSRRSAARMAADRPFTAIAYGLAKFGRAAPIEDAVS